ncbi:MAG: 4-hydroxythreonine-4-phosphate dehydrogenase PdxA [Candidatus Omnitrophica bacterium]|nr:4-hydroxythreonine-4-phosphate dehydrogenase PdxA [Candidatus Omnitrophota bacterium]
MNCKRGKKVIGVSLGDPAGIGPELLLKALPEIKKIKGAEPLVIGDAAVIEKNACFFGTKAKPNIYSPDVIRNGVFPRSKDSKICGKASFIYVEEAIELWKKRRIDALVTLPISKKAWHMAGFLYSGHTELLAERLKAKKYAMIMIADRLRVLLVTAHIPLKDVSKSITTGLIVDKLITGYDFLVRSGVKKPVIGIASVNPHGGEGGILGTEEKEAIIPAVAALRKKGIACKGPFPADAIFKKALAGDMDMVAAMYHDQALIPLKTFYFDKLVNCTAGLAMVRTSPGHGTGFDIAYKGKANPSSFIEAYKTAVSLTKKLC